MVSKEYEFLVNAANFILDAVGHSPAQKRKVASVLVHKATGEIFKQTLAVNGILYATNPMYVDSKKQCECESNPDLTYNSVFHAEEQTIMKALRFVDKSIENDLINYLLVCTFSPCYKCCRTIIMSGCKSVYYLDEHPTNFTCPEIEGDISPKGLLTEYGVKAELLDIKNIQKLEDVSPVVNKPTNMIVYHSADVDGLLSGYLLHDFVCRLDNTQKLLCFGYNYEMTHEFMSEINVNKNKPYHIYFGDVTPPIDWLNSISSRLFSSDENKITIAIYDHHDATLNKIEDWYFWKTGKKISEDFNTPIKIIRNAPKENISAAKVIFNSLNSILNYNEDKITLLGKIVDLVSDYDTWEFTKYSVKSPNRLKVLYFHEFLEQFKTFESFSNFMTATILDGEYAYHNLEQRANNVGSFLYRIKTNEARQILHSGILSDISINSDSIQVFVIGNNYTNYYLNTLIDECLSGENEIPDIKLVPIYIGWDIKLSKRIVKFSVRASSLSKYKDVSVLPICQYFGGGGHIKAGGFNLPLTEGLELIESFTKNYLHLQ